MNQEQQEQIQQKIMGEIVRLYAKLKEGNLASGDVSASTKTEVINGKLVYTDQLLFNSTVIAEATRIDPRKLEDIKVATEQQKTVIEQQTVELVSELDKVITKIDSVK